MTEEVLKEKTEDETKKNESNMASAAFASMILGVSIGLMIGMIVGISLIGSANYKFRKQLDASIDRYNQAAFAEKRTCPTAAGSVDSCTTEYLLVYPEGQGTGKNLTWPGHPYVDVDTLATMVEKSDSRLAPVDLSCQFTPQKTQEVCMWVPTHVQQPTWPGYAG